jgi:hypothetical protein
MLKLAFRKWWRETVVGRLLMLKLAFRKWWRETVVGRSF